MNSNRSLFVMLAVLCGFFLFWEFNTMRRLYWLHKDTKSAVAVVTGKTVRGNGRVDYRFEVESQLFFGSDMPQNSGKEQTVYYSASHPSISALEMPETAFGRLPITLAILFVEIITLKKALHHLDPGTPKVSHDASGTLRDIELVLRFDEGALRDVNALGTFEAALEQAWAGELGNMADRPLLYLGIKELKILVSNPSRAFELLRPTLEHCSLLHTTTVTYSRESTGLNVKLWPKDF